MQVKKISTGYTPRELQNYLHNSLRRFNVLVCHRRFGKTVFSINEMIDQGLRNTRHNPQYFYIAPTYGQAKRVAWQYFKDYTKNLPNVEVNESELRITVYRPATDDRILFQLLGAENPGAIRGVYADGVILDEMGEMAREIWGQVVRPALSDRIGWCIFIGTPKGRNLFYDLYTFATTGFWPGSENEITEAPSDWFGAKLKASETGIIQLGELDAAKQTMTADEYNQEYECDFTAALVGAYYGREMQLADSEGRITKVPYDQAVGVETFWDLGMSDATAIWFVQRCGREFHIIDYVEVTGKGLPELAKIVREKPYLYDMHNFPHDLAARELGTGKSRIEIAESLFGRQYVNVMKKDSIDDGINAVKTVLGKCWFDSTKCAKGIEALKAYERKWDSKNTVFMQKPLHNWASHGADAFRGFAMNFSDRPRNAQRTNLPTKANNKYSPIGRR